MLTLSKKPGETVSIGWRVPDGFSLRGVSILLKSSLDQGGPFQFVAELNAQRFFGHTFLAPAQSTFYTVTVKEGVEERLVPEETIAVVVSEENLFSIFAS